MSEKVLKRHLVSIGNWLKTISLVFMLGSSFACQYHSQAKLPITTNPSEVTPNPTPTKENKKMSEDYIKALQQHDRSILDKAQQAPKDLPKDIDTAISSLDEEARLLAIELVIRQDNEYSGRFLLRRLNDASPNVASVALRGIYTVIHKPSTDDILVTIPAIDDPFIRGKLDLEIGTRKEEDLLGKLRAVAAKESDKGAKLQALAALVKLGGREEKSQMLDIVRATKPEDALKMQDLLLYIGNPSMANGLIPWLDNNTDVMRIGSDRQNMMARMCDVGVWTAHLLKIELPFETTRLRNFTPQEIEQTRKILELIAD